MTILTETATVRTGDGNETLWTVLKLEMLWNLT
jgi:hypothetical protein